MVKLFKKQLWHPRKLISWTTMILLAGLLQLGEKDGLAMAQPCPKETTMYGGA